ncbi:MAG: hypothetical protein Q8J99_18930 [Sulfuritalea sp.]|nr:hypothetical protein [Sulfuritalea sp.]
MRLVIVLAALLAMSSVRAEDNVLLIQMQPGGGFTVWHTEGESRLTDDEVMELEVTARPGGGAVTQSSLGPARVHEAGEGVTIHLLDAKNDRTLLIDRDDCNHVRVWHAAGATRLSDDQITDIFISALPGGGKRITVGNYHVKAFISKLGVIATLWRVPAGR